MSEASPPEALAVARRMLAALRSGDSEKAADVLLEDAEWYGSVGGLEPGLASGRETVRRAFEAYRATWEDHGFEEQATVAGGDRVLMLLQERARGVGSGVAVEQPSAAILTLAEGKVARVVSYLDVDRALADFGVPDEERAVVRGGGEWELRGGRLVGR